MSYKNRDRFLELGLAIASLRKMKGLSQDALAAKAGISRSHLSAIEAPNIIRAFSVEVLYNLADALEIRPGELLDCDIYAYHDAGGTL
ncbi:MAG: helix-turn-helix domain-containing protein [Evtepia sp.]